MNFKSFLSAIGSALFALAVIFLQVTAPAFAAPIGINSSTPSGSLSLPSSQEQDLPGFTNTSGVAVKLEIRAEGQWNLTRNNTKFHSLDANGLDSKYDEGVLRFPQIKIGAVVAEIKDAQGNLKSVISGKQQTFELQPGETVSFIVNDDVKYYSNNTGIAKINYSVVPACNKEEKTPVKPTPTPVIPTPVPPKLGCNLDGANANPEFFANIVYKSFEGDSPFRSLVSSSNPLTSSFSFSGSNTASSEWFELEKFEGPKFENNTIGVKYRPNEIVKTSTDPTYWDSVDADDGKIDGASRSQGRFVLQKDGDIKFEFDGKRGFPTDVGLVWTDIHANAPKMDGNITFEAFDATGKSLGVRGPIYVGGDGTTVANPQDDRFFGLHYNGGISAFNVKSTVVQVGVEYDHLQYGRKCL